MIDSYSMALIRRLLDEYASLEEGRLPARSSSSNNYYGPRLVKRSSHNNPAEAAVIRKCDIDRAIQKLPPEQKFIVLSIDIDGRGSGECAYWLGKTIGYVMRKEDKAIRYMAKSLSGKIEAMTGSF